MTPNFMRPAIGMVIALCLAGCGGTASFDIGGTVVGLNYDGLVLTTNGMVTDPPIKANKGANVTFKFPKQLSYGDVYNVTVKTDPPHQTCSIGAFQDSNGRMYTGATDTAGRPASINIGVQCVVDSFPITGKITGLTSEGLVLINGSVDSVAPIATATDFAFGIAVPYGISYGVSVLTQPAKEVCTVTNGTGTMLLDRVANPTVTKIDNILVSCVPKT